MLFSNNPALLNSNNKFVKEGNIHMKMVTLGKNEMTAPAVVAGCMRLGQLSPQDLNHFIHTALELGVNHFDHADIYGGGMCEELFGKALAGDSSVKREDMIIQSKAGIRQGFYDSSKEYLINSVDALLKRLKEYILNAVDGILSRLKTDYLDTLLIHRPDALVEPEEVAEAFDHLYESGKVRHFGVSNHNPMQIELLKKYVKQPLIANQLQFSIPVSNMVAAGMEVNMDSAGSVNRDGSVLDYSRLNDMTIQAWSPFQMANWQGVFLGSEKFPELNAEIAKLCDKYGVSDTTIASSWILRHPANMQLISGTASEKRLAEIAKGAEIVLSREEWYKLYLSAGHILP